MKKYVVGYLSLHDGELKQELVEAYSKFEAAMSYLGWTREDIGEAETYEELQETLFNQDSYINVLQLTGYGKKATTSGPPIRAGLND
jgi:hypothetical protein